ncbi:MAG: hypothetical protein SFZ03_07830 [Candidatus Melainabacteria bacterium]|nr:hypothetical protein [Candidatus Melainabacteria bacterium]
MNIPQYNAFYRFGAEYTAGARVAAEVTQKRQDIEADNRRSAAAGDQTAIDAPYTATPVPVDEKVMQAVEKIEAAKGQGRLF